MIANPSRVTRDARPPTGETDRPDWEVEGRDWPNRSASRFVRSGGLTWHVQEIVPETVPPAFTTSRDGRARRVVLLHGTGAATHSWRELLPLIGAHAPVLAIDLPGHGFTDNPGAKWLAIDAMAKSVDQLLRDLGIEAVFGVGHSAGAALLVRMALDHQIKPRGIVSINGALMPFGGVGRTLFPALARVLFLNPFAPRVFAWQGQSRSRVKSLLDNTGSDLAPEQVDAYWSLMRYPSHISGALGMMANWDLEALIRDIPDINCDLLLIAAGGDKTVPPDDANKIADRTRRAQVIPLSGLGHLAHEEDARRVSALILEFKDRLGL